MRVAVIDVGSNTARLLVAERDRDGLVPVTAAKSYLRLGAEIVEHGGVRRRKLEQTSTELRRFAAAAQQAGAAVVDVFVTAPGRQAQNGADLVAVTTRATGHIARVLSAEEEGVLAFDGALATTLVPDGAVAVCDVGGGSTELVVGTRDRGAGWARSVDVGSLRLTAAELCGDPPTRKQLNAAKRFVRTELEQLESPPVDTALAVGGSARALARLLGVPLTVESLDAAVSLCAGRSSTKLARAAALEPARARTLAGGAVILREVCRVLGTPLEIGRGGVREGAAARLLLAARAAA
jgi:exopolyphosphatase/guanosine-5'-triphosphate,3'-diphosphate pyrophosphatase